MKTGSHLTDYRPPGGRTPPGDLVRQLRDIDERAELIYVGRARWLLGTVRPDRELRIRACRIISACAVTFARADWANLPKDIRRQVHYRAWKNVLRLQGFRDIVAFEQYEPNSAIAESFRMADWLWKHRFKEAEREAEHIDSGNADLEERVQRVEAYSEDEMKNVYRHAFRKPHSLDQVVDFEHGRIVREGPNNQPGVHRAPDVERRSAVA